MKDARQALTTLQSAIEEVRQATQQPVEYTLDDFKSDRVRIDFRNCTIKEIRQLSTICKALFPDQCAPAYTFGDAYFCNDHRWFEGGPHNLIGNGFDVCRVGQITLPTSETEVQERDDCLAAFEEWMADRRLSTEKVEGDVPPFKVGRVEAMWEGFICAWGMRQPEREAVTQKRQVDSRVTSILDTKLIYEFIDWYKLSINECGIDYARGAEICHYFDRLIRQEAASKGLLDNWQPIESAPKDRPILVVVPGGYIDIASWQSNNRGFLDYYHKQYVTPLYWMELPKKPDQSRRG